MNSDILISGTQSTTSYQVHYEQGTASASNCYEAMQDPSVLEVNRVAVDLIIGRGCVQNCEAGFRRLVESVEHYRGSHKKCGLLLYNLALAYYVAKGTPRDRIKAGECLQLATEEGDLPSICGLGQAYLEGFGVVQNKPRAKALLEQAAAGGNTDALWILATMYRDGKGVEQNHAEALRLLQSAIEKKNAYAMFIVGEALLHGRLALVGKQDPAQGIELLQQAVALHEPEAMCELGKALLGGDGIAQNDKEGLSLLTMSANLGNCRARWFLSTYYDTIQQTSEDRQTSEMWYSKARQIEGLIAMPLNATWR